MAFSLKIDLPYRATAGHRAAPADIQDIRQNGRWQNRRPIFGNVAAYATSSALIFALGIGASSLHLAEALQRSAYDMTPTGSIATTTPEKAIKARSCDDQPRTASDGMSTLKSDAAARF